MTDTTTSWQGHLSRDEVRDLLTPRDWRSWLSLLTDWGLVGAAFALVARWPNPLTVVVALLVIGARQLGFAILMHEAAHRTLFCNRRLNDWVGNWLCAFPIWSDLRPYRPYHLQHHAKTWTADDPDLGLANPFPITRASLARKVWRDLSGQTGWKRLKATVRRDLPSAIRIGVVERVPVAAIDDRSGRVIAADGTVLPGADGRGLPQVDVVTGTDLTAAGAVLGAIPTPWRSQVTRVTTDVDGTLVLELVGGGRIRYGYPEQVRAKGAVIGALLARGRQPGERVPTTIDVSAPSAPTTGPTIGS